MLAQIQTQSKKTKNIKKWLILASRILAIAALVIAFAQPYIPTIGKTIKQKNTAIYIDNSLSMSAEGEAGQLLENAKSIARNIVKGLENNAKVQILSNDLAPQSFTLSTKENAILAIDEITISPAKNELSSILNSVQQLAAKEHLEGSTLFVLSDFQKNQDFETIEGDSSIALELIPIANNNAGNISIDSVWLAEPVSQQGRKVNLSAKVSNHGSESIESATLNLAINERQQAAESFSLDAKENKIINLSFSPREGGLISGKLSITDYPIIFDDTYFFTLDIQSKIEVLIISGNPKNDVYFDKIFQNDSLFGYETSTLASVKYTELPSKAFVVLHSAENISTGLSAALNSFVKNGGVLLHIPSDKQANYTEFLNALALPSYGAVQTPKLSIATEGMKGKFYADVFEKTPTNVLLPTVQQHYTISGNTLGFSPILQLKNNQTIIGQKKLENGMIFLSGVPLDSDWSNFYSSELFIVTLLKMAFSKAVMPTLAYTLGQEKPILWATPLAINKNILLSKEANAHFMKVGQANGGSTLWLNSQIKEAGIYNLAYQNSTDTIGKIALNMSRSESVMEFLDEAKLKKSLEKFEIAISDGSANAIKNVLTKNGLGKKMWHIFIILCLIFLLIEVLLLRFYKP